MKYPIPVKKDQYYKAILLILNQLGLNLTELDITVLAGIFNNGVKSINKQTRKIIRESLNLDQFTFNNYIKRLKDKGVLIKIDNELKVNPTLEEKVKDKEVHIIFTLYDN